eukprot:INCI5033.15.p2 GENE.INCI5033.15~~INCI5033.15.p2  ORF type:complete len:170 (+),score=41.60 INCI5033.15:4706-5215(+)
MGNPEFHRFLQAVGIEMSREEAATIFYAILHNDNSGSSSGGTSPANSAPATNGVQAEPRLQLLPRIGFLQFDSWFQEIIDEHQKRLSEQNLSAAEREQARRRRRQFESAESDAIEQQYQSRVRALIVNKAQRAAAKQVIEQFRKKDPPLLLFAINDEDDDDIGGLDGFE